MRLSGIIAVATAALMSIGLARAETSGPSTQQIIQALKPSGNISSTTRGLVPLSKSNTTATTHNPSISLNIEFALGSARLTPTAVTELNRLGQALTDKALAGYHFRLVGHTDTTGTAALNLALSKSRADAVKAYLTTKFAIPADRLSATGVGESDLLVPTGPNVANQANRRVQIINTGR